MAVSAEEDDVVGGGFFEQTDELEAFGRDVRPLFIRVVGGDDLDAGNDEPEVSRFTKFGFEPSPLGIPEDGRLGVGDGLVFFPFAEAFFLKSTAEIAGVEIDDLEAFSFGALDVGVINARGLASGVICGETEGVLEVFLRLYTLGEFATRVVYSVVVVVPDGEDPVFFSKGRVAG